ncbi:cleavage/polyadenylation factor ia subunit Clp1p [Calocera cornea HHB12733]|uniref:Polynucleotide 5'-hydroxyl-kinase GRC3 n=1 Tax=Calocera cornea HHB12733 TaxID=1353952 RepID=A0A165J9J2_9BASI|nr:cleavage/polyadenylation factor ia subunit Clp1p [Calocera cornea HHB12733]
MSEESRQCILNPKTELRFELDPGETITLRLVSGRAELFGAELPRERAYHFTAECKAAVFTWHGCTLEVTGHASTEYVAEETPMVSYANCHAVLEQMRVRSSIIRRSNPTASSEAVPPRVLVLGAENSGKTTLCKILLNYALRAGQGWSPLVVNLNTWDGAWTVPGTISASHLSSPVVTTTADNPYGSTATSAPGTLSSSALLPLVFWFGHVEPKQNLDYMGHLIHTLALKVEQHSQDYAEFASSGLFIDTPPAFAHPSQSSGQGTDKYALVTACVEAFHVNTLIVMGNEKLTVEMQKRYGDGTRQISVVKVPRSGGVVEIDTACRRRLLSHQLRSYFYGARHSDRKEGEEDGDFDPESALAPTSSVVSFNDLRIYRVGEESLAPSSALPIGASRAVSTIQPVLVDPSSPMQQSRLLNGVLALLAPLPANVIQDDLDLAQLLDRNVSGFLVITAVDQEQKTLTVLAPSAASLEGRVAMLGSIEWQEA